MRLCPFAAVVFTTLVLLHSGCDKKPEPEAGIPKGYGVLTVLVQDESGKPIVGAEVTIEKGKVLSVRPKWSLSPCKHLTVS